MNDAEMVQEWTTMLNAKGWKRDCKARNGEVRLGTITGDRFKIYNQREEAHKLTHGTKAAKPLSHEDEQEVMANRVDKGHASFGDVGAYGTVGADLGKVFEAGGSFLSTSGRGLFAEGPRLGAEAVSWLTTPEKRAAPAASSTDGSLSSHGSPPSALELSPMMRLCLPTRSAAERTYRPCGSARRPSS